MDTNETDLEMLHRELADLRRIRDRYHAMLHDEAENRRRMEAAALASARCGIGRALHFELRRRLGKLDPSWVLGRVDEVIRADRPTRAQLTALRVALNAWRDSMRRFTSNELDPMEGAAQSAALEYLRAENHERVVAWQEMGGRPDDLGAWDKR